MLFTILWRLAQVTKAEQFACNYVYKPKKWVFQDEYFKDQWIFHKMFCFFKSKLFDYPA